MQRSKQVIVSLAAYAIALTVTAAFWDSVFENIPFAAFFAAIAASAWVGGILMGGFITALSAVSTSYLLVVHHHSMSPTLLLPIFILSAVGFLISFLADTRIKALGRATVVAAERQRLAEQIRDAHDDLEQRVAERTELLRQSEERFRLLVSCVQDYAIFMLDEKGVIQSWNHGAETIKGYSANEIIGKHFSILYPEEAQKLGTPARVIETAIKEGRVEDEGLRVRKDGTTFWANVIITALRDSTGKLRGFAKITRDMTQSRRLDAEREALLREQLARGEAEKASQIKDEFLSVISHELRTPLTPIVGWTRMLLKGMDQVETRRGLTVIDRNVKAQMRLVEDLLDISRIISGKIKLDCTNVGLAQSIEAAMDAVRPSAEAKGIRLTFVLEQSVGPVWGDAARLQQIVWNFLTNAVKFTPNGGKVEIRLHRIGTNARLDVVDTGEGIDPQYLPHVFDRFSQYDSSTTRRHGGLGIGLSIVKQLVEMHGGKTWAYSEGAGKGATFSMELPLKPQTAQLPVLSPVSTQRITNLGLDTKHILVVDDEADSRDVLQYTLRRTGATVTTAGSVEEALNVFASNKIDILVSDIGMPGDDGFVLIRKLRERGLTMPAIAVTAYARTEDRGRVLASGFERHIAKPIDPDELCAAVSACLNAS